MTFFRYARTKGGGMGYFAMFYPVLHCRNALKVRYLLYYTCNIAQSALCRLLRAANVRNRQTQSTQANKQRVQNTLKYTYLCACALLSLSLCLFLSVCFSVRLSVVFLSVLPEY